MIKFLKRESNLVEVKGMIKSIRIEKDVFLLKIASDDLLGLANYNDMDLNELHQKYARGEFFTTNINPIFLQTIYKLYKKGKSCFFTFKGLNITAVELEEFSKDSIIINKEDNTEKIEEIKNFVKEVEHETENDEINPVTLIKEAIDEISIEKYQEQMDLNEIQAISEEFKEEITPVAMAHPNKEMLVSEFEDKENKTTTLDELENELNSLEEADITIDDSLIKEEKEEPIPEAVQEAVIEEIKEEKAWPKVEYLVEIDENDEQISNNIETEIIETLTESESDKYENTELEKESREVTEELVEELINNELISEKTPEIKEENLINNLDTIEEELPEELNKSDLIQEKLDELTELNEYEALKDEIMKKDSEEISYTENNTDEINKEQTEKILDTLSSFSSIMESLDSLNELSKEIDKMENELKEYDLPKEQEEKKEEEFDVDLDETPDLNNEESLPEEILNELENASSPVVEEFDTIEEENLSEIDKLSIEIEDVDTLEEIELQKLETPKEKKEVSEEKEDKKSIEDEISDFEDELPTKIF